MMDRGGLGNQDTAISGNSAPTERARCPGKQKDHEQLERAASVFGGESAAPAPVDLKELHAKIGQLALENDFLTGALTKAGMLSAKR